MNPSRPASSLLKEDLTVPQVLSQVSVSSPDRKGKQRLPDDGSTSEDDLEGSTGALDGVYPPGSDSAAETRRVEENLRQWEIAERQRRKATRESLLAKPATSPPSVLDNVVRGATSLWKPSGWAQLSGESARDDTESSSHEDMTLGTMVGSTITPPRPSYPQHVPSEDDPFADHPASNTEPNTPTAFMTASADTPMPTHDGNKYIEDDISRPVLVASSSSFSKPAPPKPLDLPSPKAPPPKLLEDQLEREYPSSDSHQYVYGEVRETRWWHEWLCGCGESSYGGTDSQAGRTNPFE